MWGIRKLSTLCPPELDGIGGNLPHCYLANRFLRRPWQNLRRTIVNGLSGAPTKRPPVTAIRPSRVQE